MLPADVWRTLLLLDMEVQVALLDDVKVGGRALRRGERVQLSLREALPLIRGGRAVLEQGGLPSQTDLNRALFMERQLMKEGAPLPSPLPYDFYARARLSIMLERDAAKARAMQAMLLDLVRLRLQKILRAVAASPEQSRDLAERLTLEERALYAHLCSSVGAWSETMRRLIEEGNPLA